jgi:hypothetical protein
VEFFGFEYAVAGDDYRILAGRTDPEVICLPQLLNSLLCNFPPGFSQ